MGDVVYVEPILVQEFGYDKSGSNASYPRQYQFSEDDRTNEDIEQKNRYMTIQVVTNLDDYKKYSGINIDKANKIMSKASYENTTPHQDLVIEYPPDVLYTIHNDMSGVDISGSFPTDIMLNDNQVDLVNSTHRLYYKYESTSAVNDSDTGVGKTVMAMAQGLLSGNPYWIINCPAQAQHNWKSALRSLPGIRDDLYRLYGIWYRWPIDILLVSTHQLRGKNGHGVSVFRDRKNGTVQLLNKKPGSGPPVYEVTGNSYNLQSERTAYFGDGINSPHLTPDYSYPFNQFCQYNANDQYNTNLTFRGLNEAGVFLIIDEWHSSKNNSATSHANGAMPYEIMTSRGGVEGYYINGDQVVNDPVVLVRDYNSGILYTMPYVNRSYSSEVFVPYGGALYGSLNRIYDLKDRIADAVTGRSRVLLLSATITDKSNAAPMGRPLGLYIGGYKANSSTYNTYINNMTWLLNTIGHRYMAAVNAGTYEESEPPSILREEFYNQFREGSNYPPVNTSVINILSDPFFVKAISYDGDYILRMTDLIIPLPNNRAERDMKQWVESASAAIGGGKDGEEGSSPSINSTIALMNISVSLVDEVVLDVVRTIMANPSYRAIITFRFNHSIARAANYFLQQPQLLQQLGIIAPLIMSGGISTDSRKYVAALFNSDLRYRLLIAQQEVVKESNSYHDVHGGRETTIWAEIPNSAVSLYQLYGRILRIGVKSDSELKIVSPGLRYGFEFHTIPEVRSALSQYYINRQDIDNAINDDVINRIIEVHKQMVGYGYSTDDIHVKLAYNLDDHIVSVFLYLLEQLMPGLANIVYWRMTQGIEQYMVSLVDLLRRRDRKTEQLKALTSKVRYVPQSDGFYEVNSIVASYIDRDELDEMRNVANIIRRTKAREAEEVQQLQRTQY